MNAPNKKTKNIQSNIWVAKFDGKQMHLTHAIRLPRVKKKLIRTCFDMLGPRASDYVMTSPKYTELMEEAWENFNNALVSGKNENLKKSGHSLTEQ